MADTFTGAKYVSLRSYKRNGDHVDTPVWFAHVGEQLMVFTDGTSYKVKRIRRNPKIQIALCDVRGNLRGPWQRATCRAIENKSEPQRVAAAYSALNAKYGLLMRFGTVFATMFGRARRRLILEITLDDAA